MKAVIDSYLVTPKKIWSIDSSKETLRIRRDAKIIAGEKKFDFYEFHEFDPDSMLLSKHRHFMYNEEGTKATETLSWSMEWQKVGLLSVPKSFRRKEYGAAPVADAKIGDLITNTRFHWKAVNEKVDEKLFGIANFNSLEQVMELTDLKKNGADELESKVKRRKD